jgi:EAL domain-containing protein (putative c-di-GMP-specific phosphodiesterase class I)
VLRQACADAARWPAPLRVAVNLSPAQFGSRVDLDRTVADALREAGLEPGRLELEITEGVLLHDTDATVATLDALKALGVRVAMDDFGTGYSSLGYLQRFPFDTIKIDQSFVRDLGSRPGPPPSCARWSGLGRSLGLRTCAEGVETAEQLALLRREGCDEMQGYYFGRPVPAAEITRLLATGRHLPRVAAVAS